MIKSLIKTYSKLNITKKSILWFTVSTIIQNGILFLVTPIYTRILSDSEYGIFSIYQSWQQLISIISILALDRCITVGMVKYSENRTEFLSSIQTLMTTLVLGFILIVLAFPNLFVRIINLPLIIIIIMFIVALLNSTLLNWSCIQRFNYSYKKLTFVTIISTLLMQISALIAVIFVNNINKGIVMILAMSVVRLIIYGCIYISVILKGKKFFSKKYWKFGLKYSIAVVPHALSQVILNSSDRIMIDKICGREQAAYYGVTYSLAMALNVVITSISTSVQPWFFQKIKEKDYDSIRQKTNALLIIPVVLSISVSLFAPEILTIMAPSSYNSSLYIFPAIAVSIFFNNLFLYFANLESYYEKPIYFSIATTVGALINIILNLVLLPIYGFVVAGYTTLICYILFAIMHYIFMKRVCKINNINENVFDMKYILILSIIVILLPLCISVLYKFLIIRYIIIIFLIVSTILKRKFIINNLNKIYNNKN